MSLHVRYTCWYISLPFYAQLQREMTKFKVLPEHQHMTATLDRLNEPE